MSETTLFHVVYLQDGSTLITRNPGSARQGIEFANTESTLKIELRYWCVKNGTREVVNTIVLDCSKLLLHPRARTEIARVLGLGGPESEAPSTLAELLKEVQSG